MWEDSGLFGSLPNRSHDLRTSGLIVQTNDATTHGDVEKLPVYKLNSGGDSEKERKEKREERERERKWTREEHGIFGSGTYGILAPVFGIIASTTERCVHRQLR